MALPLPGAAGVPAAGDQHAQAAPAEVEFRVGVLVQRAFGAVGLTARLLFADGTHHASRTIAAGGAGGRARREESGTSSETVVVDRWRKRGGRR